MCDDAHERVVSIPSASVRHASSTVDRSSRRQDERKQPRRPSGGGRRGAYGRFNETDNDGLLNGSIRLPGMLGRQLPKVETTLRDAADGLLAFTGFPPTHWKKVWSTNPLERLNKEIKRRTDVVGVFPTPASLLRLAGAVLVEAHDEWQTGDRRYLAEGTMALLLDAEQPEPTTPELVAS